MKLSPPTRLSEPPSAAAASLGRLSTATPPRRRKPFGPLEWFLVLVALPTAIVAAYYIFIAANIYASEARFIIRAREFQVRAALGAQGTIIGTPAATGTGEKEMKAVMSFIDSYEAVGALRREQDLVGVWRRPEADFLARLWWEDPSIERLLRYYRRRIFLEYDQDTGVARLEVRAFRPDDAQQIAQSLIRLAETLVNDISYRSMEDTLRTAREEVELAQRRVIEAREALVSFREREQAFDPVASATRAQAAIGQLETQLTAARTELQERRAFMRGDNPQIQVLQNRIAALQVQISAERSRVTRGDEALTPVVAGYERVLAEKEFAEGSLGSAINTMEVTRAEATRQQVFLMRVAEAHFPERAWYPRATFNTITVFVGLSVLFGIGWLLVAGFREHAN